MTQSRKLALSLAAATLFYTYALPVSAQGAETGARINPADAQAPVPRVVYQSSFSTYQAFSEQEIRNWRESNDNVARIGGWRAYAKEAREPQAKAAKPGAPVSPAAPSDTHRH